MGYVGQSRLHAERLHVFCMDPIKAAAPVSALPKYTVPWLTDGSMMASLPRFSWNPSSSFAIASHVMILARILSNSISLWFPKMSSTSLGRITRAIRIVELVGKEDIVIVYQHQIMNLIKVGVRAGDK